MTSPACKSIAVAMFEHRGYALHEDWTLQMRSVAEFYSENMMVFSAAHDREAERPLREH